jgi:nitrogen fixation protein
MSDLVVPLIIVTVLAAIVWYGSRFQSDPHANWTQVAEKLGLTFYAPNADMHEMSITGELEGTPITLRCRHIHSGRARQFVALVEVRLPEIPHDLTLARTVSARQALARAGAADRHDPTLEKIWSLSSEQVALLTAIREDHACGHRLTNMLVSFPHAKLEDGLLSVEGLGDFGPDAEGILLLSVRLAQDLTRVATSIA